MKRTDWMKVATLVIYVLLVVVIITQPLSLVAI